MTSLPVLRCFLVVAILLWTLILGSPVGRAEGEPQKIPECYGRDLLADLRIENRQAYERWVEGARKIPNGAAMLWRIEGKGLSEPSWLFGTLHVTDPRILELPDATREAFLDARNLAVEIRDIDSPWKEYFNNLFALPSMYLAGNETWRDYLGEAELKLMQTVLAEYGHTVDQVERLQPWTVSLFLLFYPNCETWRAYLGLNNLDIDLAVTARKMGKPVIGLETRYEASRTIAATRATAQFKAMLAMARYSGRPEDELETAIQAYLSRRIPLYQTYELAPYYLSAEEIAALRELDHHLIDRRNLTMRDRSLPLIRKGRAFIAVGAAHLPGDQGLVELFRKAGYEVTPVN